MNGREPSAVAHDIRTLFDDGAIGGLTDGQLLERFVSRSDESAEAAFAVLVQRHGTMVWGVCRRILHNPHDAADAFQAIFLVLVRRASSVRVEDSLGRWLYGVSRRVAARAKRTSDRRSTRERGEVETIEEKEAVSGPERAELLAILDEEIAKLPERYRAAVVLCDLGGLSHEEAACRLDCAVGTIGSRLTRGRERLRSRLVRRGLAPAAGVLTTASLRQTVAMTVPAGLVESTVREASYYAVGQATIAGAVSGSAVLAKGVLTSMVATKLKLAAAVLLTGVLVGGAVVPTLRASGSQAINASSEITVRKGAEKSGQLALEPVTNKTAESERSRDDPEDLREEIEIKKRILDKALAQRELAMTVISIHKRLNQRQKGLVSQEEMAKSEAEFKVASAEVEVIKAQIHALQVRLDRVTRRQDQPGEMPDTTKGEAQSGSPAGLERRLGTIEVKLDRVLQELESIKNDRTQRRGR